HAMMHLYKISQEALSNSIKHGKARHVVISLATEGQSLRLSIENDGAPFSPPASKDRLGLRIMRYRANSIGATLEMKSVENSGAAVICMLPLETCRWPAIRRAPKKEPAPVL